MKENIVSCTSSWETFLKQASSNRLEGRTMGPSNAQAIALMPWLVSFDPSSNTEHIGEEEAKHVASTAQESGK